MAKNKYIYGAACKSQPIPNSRTELTENLPETNRRGWGIQPIKRATQKQSIQKANFLFFLSFICFALLTIPTTGWSKLTGLRVDSGGDTVFRGGVDRLRITFTVDEDSDGDSYEVAVGNVILEANGAIGKFTSLGIIDQGTVSADETVELFWDGTLNGTRLPDKIYGIRVTVDDGDPEEDEVLTTTATLDTSRPRVSGVVGKPGPENEPEQITDGSFIRGPLRSIEVTEAGEADLSNRRNTVFLRNAQQAVVQGTLNYDDGGDGDGVLTFTLVDPLDEPSENGKYTLILILIDKAGNVVQSLREFTFDNVDPRVARISTNRRAIVPGGGINQRITFVEATLTDNLPDGINPLASSISLIGPDGEAIPGNKTVDSRSGRIRWDLLSPLLGTDDSQQGKYTVTVTAVDKAGNSTIQDVSFVYDSRAPELDSLILRSGNDESVNFVTDAVGDTVYHNRPINGFVATFKDDSDPIAAGDQGVGVSLTGGRQSTQLVFGTPKKSGDGLNVRAGRVVTDSDNNTLTYILNKPIVSRDGSQDGRYTLNVRVTDIAGNTKTYSYQLIYDTQVPTLVSTTPASNETVSELSQVQVKLDEKTSGIDFVGSTFQLMREGADAPVPVNVTSNGIDTATLTLTQPIALDGSDDGVYTIEVTPADLAGNRGATVVREFYLVSQKHEPEIRLTQPETTTVSALPTVAVELVDYVGAGIDFDASTVVVRNPEGAPVSQEKIVRDETNNALTWTTEAVILPDGSADGEYTIIATFVDFTGKSFTQQFSFVLDTQVPEVESVHVAIESQPELSVETITTLTESFSQIIVTFEDTLGDAEQDSQGPSNDVNFANTVVELAGSANAIPTNVSVYSPTQLAIRFVELIEDGSYTLSITPQDSAGNAARGALRYEFMIDTESPRITAASPITLSEPVSYIGTDFRQFVFTIEDVGPADLFFEEQTIALLDAAGNTVPTTLTYDEPTGQLYLRIVSPFAQDGSSDGEYSVKISLVDKAGNRSDSEHAIVYDSKVPQLSSVVLNTEASTVLEPQLMKMITEPVSSITLQFEEATRIDVTNTAVELVGPANTAVEVTSPGTGESTPKRVPSNVSVDTPTQLTIRFVELIEDGFYALSVTPRDIVGNAAQGPVRYAFMIDTEAPQITAPTPLIFNQSPVTYIGSALRQFQFAFTVTDVGPADLYLEEQTIEVVSASGVSIPVAVTYDELTNQIFLSLPASFPRDGSVDGEYTVKVSLVDKAGNRSDSEYTAVYDSKAPQIGSVMVNTDPPMALVPNRIAELVEPINSITVQFEEATRINFANTQITLTGPEPTTTDGEATTPTIPLTLEDDGVSQVTLSFLDLEQIGTYTLSVTAQDVAGNAAAGAVEYRFIVDIPLPVVDSVVIGGIETEGSGEVSYINASNTRIEAVLLDLTETGISFSGDGSDITVTESGSTTVVPGTLSFDGTDRITWEPKMLAADGIADGRYSVFITPVDKAGRRGETVYREFIYDTQEPHITTPTPLIFNQNPVTYIGSALRQFQFSFTVEDVGPAGLYLADQTLVVLNAAGENIPIGLTSDELTNQLFLSLPASLPRDGSADGEYTVKISLVDKAGNREDSEYTIVYDSKAPQLSSVMVNTDPPMALVPNRIAEILEPVNRITLQFEEATGINFANTQITLMGPESTDSAGESTTPEIPLTVEDDGASEITLSFLDLEQIGAYVLSVTTLQDVAGNAAAGPTEYRFLVEIPLPRVSAVVIGETETQTSNEVAYVNANNMRIGAFLLDPTEIGLSFGSEGSAITVTEADGTTVVPGRIGSNGEDLIVWEPVTLTGDGTTDGRYNVYVVPIDKAGRQGSTVYREFVYDTQEPVITASDTAFGPLNLSQPVSYMSQSLMQFNFAVEDIGPADLELSDQEVSLRDASGSLVPAQLTNNTENRLFLTLDQPLPLDGSMDGEYTLRVALADKAGNPYTVEHLIVYDTQAPTLVSTVPADGALLTEDITEIQVTLNDEGGSGIDWTTTAITLVDPDGTEISGELVSDGETEVTLTTNQLVADGRYIIRVKAIDRAGNGDAVDFEHSFILSRRLPTIVSTEPVTAPADEAFMNEEVERIEVTLETDDENHLSTLRLLTATDQVITGQLERSNDQLIYNLVRPLATDGSDDGVYVIEFTPISASGRSGEVQRLTFTYDTQAPEIEPDEAISLVVAEPEVNNSLTEIHVNLTDETSGIDWENLDEAWLTFERLSPNPTKISGRISDDGGDNLTFRLTVPLADNGSADGEYRITLNPKDRAGNDDEPYEKVFIYDTSPPMIDASTLLINDAPLLVDINAENYPTAVSSTGGVVVQANIFDTGLGVNLAQSKIIVKSPDGLNISGSTQQNGVDTLVFKSDGLTVQGVYKITVMSIGNDSELLGFAPTDSLTTEFLYETTAPTAAITSDGGETELTDKALPLEGTAADPSGTQRIGEGEIQVPASGVWLVEIVGIGPDKQPIDPVAAVDDSGAEQEPWSVWSIDYLPTRSGEYDLDVRVTDNAGNYEVYDIGEYTMSVSLTFRGTTFGWPNPLRLSKRDVAFFSFDVNVPRGDTIELTLSIYDWSGDMVLSQTYPDVVSGQRNDQLVKWNLENQAGTPVARGLYVFRLEAINAAGNRANVVGKVLVVD